MGTTRKTITVTEQQDKWIKAQIDGGDFTNDSEYIRDLIRRDHFDPIHLIHNTFVQRRGIEPPLSYCRKVTLAQN